MGSKGYTLCWHTSSTWKVRKTEVRTSLASFKVPFLFTSAIKSVYLGLGQIKDFTDLSDLEMRLAEKGLISK